MSERGSKLLLGLGVLAACLLGVVVAPPGQQATAILMGAMLLGASVAACVGVITTVILWRRDRDYIHFVHLATAVLIAFVVLGSCATFLARDDVGIIDTTWADLGAGIGRGALLLLTLFFAVLFVGHVYDARRSDEGVRQ